MKILVLSFAGMFTVLQALSQQKDFEGILHYKAEVKSKIPEYNNAYWKNVLVIDDSQTVYVKNGYFFRSNGKVSEWADPVQQITYLKFKLIDTLFYLNYYIDTSAVLQVIKSAEKKKIAGFDCQAVSVKTKSSNTVYFYSPLLKQSPLKNTDKRSGSFNAFLTETSSIWLASMEETAKYIITHTCSGIEEKLLDESAFKTPDLPRAEFDFTLIVKPPEFGRSVGWISYLQKNLNADIGAKYVRIPKGESEGVEVVVVSFIVSRTGELTDLKIENKKEVHPKLAEEAIRVISQSGRWKPATLFGEKIDHKMRQPITFVVSKG